MVSSGAGVFYSRARNMDYRGVLSQGSPRGAQRPTRSRQLLWEWLTVLACARPAVMVASPSSQSRHPSEHRGQGRQTGHGVASAQQGRLRGGTFHGQERTCEVYQQRAPFCSHLHRSGALLPPDCQGRMVGTHLGAKAAFLMGICTICPDRGQCLHTQGCWRDTLQCRTHCRKQIGVSPGAGTGQQTCLPEVCQVKLIGSIWQRRRASSVKGFKLKLLQERNLNLSHSYQSDTCGSHRCPKPGEGSQSAEEHLKNGAKEFQPLQPVSWHHQGPILNASVQIHTAWGVKKRS